MRSLTGADLCPPVAYVAVDDEEQQDLAVTLDAFTRNAYLRRQGP